MASHLPSVPLASLGEMLSPNTPLRKHKKLWRKKLSRRKTVKRNRPITYSFRVSERERRIIDEKVKTSGLKPNRLSDPRPDGQARCGVRAQRRDIAGTQTARQQPKSGGAKLLLLS